MKSAYQTCPACFQESLTEVPSGVGPYWRCLNQNCGQTFSPQQLFCADC